MLNDLAPAYLSRHTPRHTPVIPGVLHDINACFLYQKCYSCRQKFLLAIQGSVHILPSLGSEVVSSYAARK